jgi:plastocyanin
MATPYYIDINPAASGDPKSKFSPPAAKAKVGQVIYWRNNDSEAHWPVQKSLVKDSANKAGWWLQDAGVSGKLPDQDPPVTQEGVSSAVPWTAPVDYVCYLHPDDPDETGTLQVVA